MHAILLGVTWGMIGLDSGWKALPGGGIEYTLQIAPQELDIFRQDKSIEVDIPAKLREIHSIRVVVGNEALSREDPIKPISAASKPTTLPAWPDLRTPSSPLRKSSPYQPFAALTSLWDRYPLPQNASDPTDRPTDRDASGASRSGTGFRSAERQPRDEAPPARDTFKDRSQTTPQPSGFTSAGARDRGLETASKPAPKEVPTSFGGFTTVVLLLLGSLGGNVYMGWITWETRARYHALVRRRKKREYDSMERDYESETEGE